MADDNATLAMPEPHFVGGIARQHVCKAIERDTAPEMALAQHDGEQRFEPGTARRRAPDAAGLAGEIAVDMVGRNRIDCSIGNAGPERFTIAGLAQRWINFTDVAARETDIVRQIVRACFDGDAAAAGARGERRLQRRRRCGVNDIEPTTNRLRGEANTLYGVGLDEGWARSIPTRKAAFALGIGRSQAIA